jgi:hypothetical protein
MRRRLILWTAAIATAACSPAVDLPAEGADGGAAQKRLPLPDCAEVSTEDQGADGWKHPDCRMMLADNSGLAIEARYTKAEDESTKVAVQIVAPGDATLQTIEETMGNTFNGITQLDADGDGKTDLLLPLETGNVNTTWALWRQNDDGQTFARAGEPSGVSVERTESGYIAVPARSSASEWSVGFYKLEANTLRPAVTVDVAAEDVSGPDATQFRVTCNLTDNGGVAETGLSSEAATDRFCAEPAAANIFKPEALK